MSKPPPWGQGGQGRSPRGAHSQGALREGIEVNLLGRARTQGPGAEAQWLRCAESSPIIRSRGSPPAQCCRQEPRCPAPWLPGPLGAPPGRDCGLLHAHHSLVWGLRLYFQSSLLTVFPVGASHKAEKYNHLCKCVSHSDGILTAC